MTITIADYHSMIEAGILRDRKVGKLKISNDSYLRLLSFV
jgi:hypothetical protein